MDKMTRDALTVIFHVGIYIIPLGALFCFQCCLVLINSFVANIYIDLSDCFVECIYTDCSVEYLSS